jgi:hypothetical protein
MRLVERSTNEYKNANHTTQDNHEKISEMNDETRFMAYSHIMKIVEQVRDENDLKNVKHQTKTTPN